MPGISRAARSASLALLAARAIQALLGRFDSCCHKLSFSCRRRLAAPPHATSAAPHRRSSSLVSCVHGTLRRADSPQRLTAPPSVFCISVRFKCCCIRRGSHGRDSISRDLASRGRKSIKPRRLKMELRRSSFNHGCQPRLSAAPNFPFCVEPPVLARVGASPSECSSRVSQSGSTTNGRKQCALVGCCADTRSRQRGSCASRALPVHKIEADTAGWPSKGPRAVAEFPRGVVASRHEFVSNPGHWHTISGGSHESSVRHEHESRRMSWRLRPAQHPELSSSRASGEVSSHDRVCGQARPAEPRLRGFGDFPGLGLRSNSMNENAGFREANKQPQSACSVRRTGDIHACGETQGQG